jgi:hypothetical protein
LWCWKNDIGGKQCGCWRKTKFGNHHDNQESEEQQGHRVLLYGFARHLPMSREVKLGKDPISVGIVPVNPRLTVNFVVLEIM